MVLIRQCEDLLRQSYLGIADVQILKLRDENFNGWLKQLVSIFIYY